MSTPKACQRLLNNGGLFILLVLFAIAITSVYTAAERTFYWWDYNTYQAITRAVATSFSEGSNNVLYKAIRLLYQTWKSTVNEYNDYHTLPIVPFLLAFGDSRRVYIGSLALVYLLPFALVLGAIATKLIPSQPRLVFWSTVLIALLIPVVWAPTLRGYPDAGAALLIALAILIYFQDLQLKNWLQIALIGFLLGAAALFRRHFAYDGIAFFVSVTLQTSIASSIRVRQRSREAWRKLFDRGLRIGWMAIASLIALAVLGLPFIVKVLTTDFHSHYTSYQVSFGECLQYYVLCYGLLAWILAGLGFAVGIKTRVLNRPVAIFIILFSSLLLLQWLLVIRQPNIHYNLHFTPIIVLGFAAFGWTAWRTLKQRTRSLVLGVSSIYLIFNAVISLTAVDIINNTPIRLTRFNESYSGMGFSGDVVVTKFSALFSAHYPPLKHPDYDELVRLVKYLTTVAPAKEPIYVAGSSELFNEHIIIAADSTLQKPGRLNILYSPITDSGDYYPLETLLRAQYVVVATPFQRHLRAQEQDVVKVVVDAFAENWEFSKDFTRLPVQFTLANGAAVNVYKRLRTTSLETTVRTLAVMQERIGRRPARQGDWIAINEVAERNLDKKLLRGLDYLSIDKPQEPTPSIYREAQFLYINKLPTQARLTGTVQYADKQCTGTVLLLDAINSQGEVINTVKLNHRPSDALKFRLPIPARDAAYLLLNIAVTDDKNDSINNCSLKIKPLSVEG